VLIGCFDESGSSGEGGFVSIAGFVATEERWAAFDTAWNAALAKHSAPYLHTTDLANFKRIYKDWTVDQQRALVADLMATIWAMGRVVAIGATMAVDDFNSFSAEQRTKWVDPYYMLLQEVMNGATLEARPDDERVRIIYSQQDEFSGKFERLYRVLQRGNTRLDALTFEDMRTTPGLQAADLLAYELKRFYKNKVTRPDIPLRWPMRNILLQQHALRVHMLKYLPWWYLRIQAMPPAVIHFPVYALSDSSGNTWVLQHDNFRMGEPSTDAVEGGQRVPARFGAGP
jgi:hypothetical protein